MYGRYIERKSVIVESLAYISVKITKMAFLD